MQGSRPRPVRSAAQEKPSAPALTRTGRADSHNAQAIEFKSQGLRCRGLKYLPADLKAGEKRPCIVLAHGFSAVKEMYFTDYAEAFSKAGLVAVVFDYRYLGESEGEPRGFSTSSGNAIDWYKQWLMA